MSASTSGSTASEASAPAATRQIRGSAFLLVGRVLALLISLTTQILIVRALSKTAFGVFAYALALVPFVRVLVTLGHSQALTRFLAIYDEQREYPKLFGTIGMVIATTVGGALALLGGAFALEGWIAGSFVDGRAAARVVVLLLLLGPLEALDRIFESLFAVFSKPRSIFFRKYLLGPLLRLGVVGALVIAGADLGFLAIGYVGAGALGVVLYAVLLLRTLRARGLLAHFSPRSLEFPFRELYGFSFPLLTTELVTISINTFSVVVLAAFAGAADVAEYRAVLPAARLNQFVLFSFTLLFAPLAARLYSRGDREGMRDAYWQTAVWLAVASFPVFALTGPMARPLTVTLFGQRYADSAPFLALLAVGYYFNAALGFNALTLQTFGRIRYVVTVNVAAAAANVGLVLVLVPRLGALGAAIANAATLILQNLLNQAGLGRGIGVGIFDIAYLRAYFTVAIATAVLWAIQEVLAPPPVLAFTLVAVVSLGVLMANRGLLRIGETFPELLRLPLARRLLSERR